MAEKYRLSTFGRINKLQVLRETEKQIIFINESGKENREAKVSEYAQWCDSFQDAKMELLKRLENKMVEAKKANCMFRKRKSKKHF